MKIILTLLISCYLFPAFSQTGIQQNPNSSPEILPSPGSAWEIGVLVSPDVVYRSLIGNGPASVVKETRNDIEVPRVSYSAGLLVKKIFAGKLALETGLVYSDKGYKLRKRSLAHVDPVTQTITTLDARGYSTYKYLDLPLLLKISHGYRKIKFSGGIGVALQYFLNEKTVFHYTENGIEGTNTIKGNYEIEPFNISPSLSAGIAFDLSDKLSISIEPTFKYGLIALTDTPIAEKLYSVGLNTTVYLD